MDIQKRNALKGIESGFTSVMFDGSKLPLSENIEKTSEIVEIAHQSNVSVEGEIGFVGYNKGAFQKPLILIKQKSLPINLNVMQWR